MGAVMLQSCTVSLEVVPGSSSETGITSDDSQAVVGIKVEEDAGVTIKVEIPEPISFPSIKAEPVEVSYLSVPTVRHVTYIHKCPVSFLVSISTSAQLNNSTMMSRNFILTLACVNL
jgi:hypothetical protein